MLSKVNKSNVFLGTDQLQKLYNNTKYDLAQDNCANHILYKIANKYQIINYKTNQIYTHNKIQINILGEKIIKQIDSFDQNNMKISNKIRREVIRLCNKKNYNTLLGIGGEYYVYFKFIKASKYLGMSNHKTIVDDASNNVPFSNNYFVDYNKINIEIKSVDLIILNVYNICDTIIKYIYKINFEKLIIISCNLPDNKLKQLNSYFKIKTINHIQNFNSWIWILEISNIK